MRTASRPAAWVRRMLSAQIIVKMLEAPPASASAGANEQTHLGVVSSESRHVWHNGEDMNTVRLERLTRLLTPTKAPRRQALSALSAPPIPGASSSGVPVMPMGPRSRRKWSAWRRNRSAPAVMGSDGSKQGMESRSPGPVPSRIRRRGARPGALGAALWSPSGAGRQATQVRLPPLSRHTEPCGQHPPSQQTVNPVASHARLGGTGDHAVVLTAGPHH
jgi:hypothetical protein